MKAMPDLLDRWAVRFVQYLIARFGWR